MRKIDLKEYETSKQYRLSVSERDQLRDLLPSVSMEPAKGKRRRYHLRPGSIVGALEMDGLSVLIKPRSASRNCCRWPATQWGCTNHKNSIYSTSRKPKRYLMYWLWL